MATGGQQSPGKDMRQNTDQSSNGLSFNDRLTQWTLLPNNLELNTRSRTTKKQRNKEKSRATTSSENLSSALSSSASSGNKYIEHGFQSFSDMENPSSSKHNIKIPLNQRSTSSAFQSSTLSTRSIMENESTRPIKQEYVKKLPDVSAITERLTYLKDCISQVNAVLQHFEHADDPACKAEIAKLQDMKKTLLHDDHVHRVLLQQITVSEDPGLNEGNHSAFSKSSERMAGREINGGLAYYSEEDKTNIQNHVSEKMKVSKGKLTSLKQSPAPTLRQHPVQKLPEDKIPPHAGIIKQSPDAAQSDQEWHFLTDLAQPSSVGENDATSEDLNWEKSAYGERQSQWAHSNMANATKNTLDKLLECGGQKEEPTDLSKLHVNFEHIKKRVELLQQLSDNRNVVDISNSAEVDLEHNLGETAAAIEWQRKKLKNRLLELQEHKKVNDELMKHIPMLKEAVGIDCAKENDSTFSSANIQNAQTPKVEEDNLRTIEGLRDTIQQLRGMLSRSQVNEDSDVTPINLPASSQQDGPSKQTPHPVAPVKRDNIRKEQGDQFPARRHYEAEGRANEDADVPVAPPATAPTPPVPDTNAWENDIDLQVKQRNLEIAKRKLQVMRDLVSTMQQARSSGQPIPVELLQLVSTLDEGDDGDNDLEEDTETDNEDSQGNDDSSSVVESKTSEIAVIKTRDSSNDAPLPRIYDVNERSDVAVDAASNEEVQNIEHLKSERERLLKLHQKFMQLQHKFVSSPKQNNETMRSSGEGGNVQHKKHRQEEPTTPLSNAIPTRRPRQKNLLTRQNVETQNRNNSAAVVSAVPKAVTTAAVIKKDNMNNLSAKLNKPGSTCHPRTAGDTMCKYSTESMQTFVDVNQSVSLRDEIQHKSFLEHILKQEQSKSHDYGMNTDNQIHSNSSMNSEPLDGSGSALAPDTTVAATWGGSSTQENFEDENEEHTESLEEQEEEEEEASNNEINENISESEQIPPSVSNQYTTEQSFANFSADSSAKRRDNRLHKYFKSTQLNQWTTRKNFSRPASSGQRSHQSLGDLQQDFTLPEVPRAQPAESSQTSADTNVTATNPISNPTKFVQDLQQQLDKLNALCRPLLQEPHPLPRPASQTVVHPTRSTNSENNQEPVAFPVVNSSCRSTQTMTEIVQSYTQQLQLQQQLLLSLSQCYHALYMQQLEIQHLHRFLQQNPDAETPVNSGGSQPTSEEFTFRPWFLTPWSNTAVPATPFTASQISPMSAPPFLQPNPAFSFNPSIPQANATVAPCALVTGVQPARAVVHPAGQDIRSSNETLNNQVPPRTRANNFVDNFRSCSRQNLLSTPSSSRSKDTHSFTGGPQVRQVHPLVSNESSWSHRSRVFISPHTENNAATQPERTFARPIRNSEIPDSINRSKKPNITRQQVNAVSNTTPDTPSTSVAYNLCPETDQPYRLSTDNSSIDIPQHNIQFMTSRNTKLRGSTSANDGTLSETAPDAIHSEVAKLLSQNSYQSGCLMELLRELRNLKSDSLQRALNAVRELVNNESAEFTTPISAENSESSNSALAIVIAKEKTEPSDCTEQTISTVSSSAACGNEIIPNKILPDGSNQRNSHNWAPATIIPLGKYVPKPSTGAIKKRPQRDNAATNYGFSWSAQQASEQESHEERSVSFTPSTKTESVDNVVERVLIEVIPFVHSHAMDDCCASLRSTFCAKVIDAVKNNCSLKMTPEFLIQLHQTLVHILNRFSGIKWGECEMELIKVFTTTLFRELATFKSMSLRASLEDVCEHTTTTSKKTSQPDIVPSSKPFYEQKKPTTQHKEERDIDGGNFVCNSSQEFESHISELCIVPPEDSLFSHMNGVPQHDRTTVGGNCSPMTNSWPVQAINAEDDMGYECEPEAEGEPEIEAGTEADLAEADQSPGPQTTANGVISLDSWHASQNGPISLGYINDEPMTTESASATNESISSLGLSVQVSSGGGTVEKEITLDDIPTKLTPMSQDEIQKQMSNEQESNSLLLEVIEDITLAGNSECPEEPSAPYL